MQPDSARQESATRTREIEELTNLYFIHPLAARLTPFLAQVGVKPNWVSFTGMSCGILAGFAYYHYQDIRYAAGGFVLMVAWHILDGVDGQLARLTNSQSEFGKIIDGIADNVTFAAVYLGLGLSMSQTGSALVWLIIALAGAAHSLQAASYEVQRQEYDFWGWDKQSAELKSTDKLRRENQPRSFVQRMIYGLGLSYVRMQHLAARVDPEFREQLAGALAARPDDAQAIRRRYRESFSSLVRGWSAMSSNYRTIAIFVCAALKIPLLYFLIEILVLTPLTILMIRRQKTKCRAFSRFLNQQAP